MNGIENRVPMSSINTVVPEFNRLGVALVIMLGKQTENY